MNPSHQLPLHHLQPPPLHLHTVPQDLQSLDGIPPEANEAFFQQRYAHHLNAPSPHALHFQGHALPAHTQSPFSPFTGAPGGYGRTFDLNAPPPQQQPVLPQQPLVQHQTLARTPIRAHAPSIQRVPRPVQELEPRPEFIHTQTPVSLIPQVPTHVQAQVQPPETEQTPFSNHGQFEGLKLIPTPPDLDAWREKLFHVDDTITLTEEECVSIRSASNSTTNRL
jgi:glutathione S-transferase